MNGQNDSCIIEITATPSPSSSLPLQRFPGLELKLDTPKGTFYTCHFSCSTLVVRPFRVSWYSNKDRPRRRCCATVAQTPCGYIAHVKMGRKYALEELGINIIS
jgi:hypothetical protein